MNKLKSIFNEVDPKLKILLAVILIALLVIMLFSVVSGNITPKNLSRDQLEERMVSAGKKYAEKKPEKFENIGDIVELTNKELEDLGFLKPFSSLKKEDSCEGKVTIVNLERQKGYRANVNCKKEKNKYLKDEIMKDLKNDPDSMEPGLYRLSTSSRSGRGSGYYYRGKVINNYLKIGVNNYRIVGIDAGERIKIIKNNAIQPTNYDSTYNKLTEGNTGFNEFKISNIRRELEKKERYTYKSEEELALLFEKSNFCVGKRGLGDTSNDGGTECLERTPEMLYGLLSPYEYIIASLAKDCYKIGDRTCTNYNYLGDSFTNFWTGSATQGTIDEVIAVKYNGLKSERCNKINGLRIVSLLRDNVRVVKGDGTQSNPYIIK